MGIRMGRGRCLYLDSKEPIIEASESLDGIDRSFGTGFGMAE